MNLIAKRPLITEKTLALAAKGWYTFVVDDQAEKKAVASAVGKQYKVDVVAVRTVSMHGKVRRVGKRQVPIAAKGWKKAMVQVKSGQKIDAFEVVGQEGEKTK